MVNHSSMEGGRVLLKLILSQGCSSCQSGGSASAVTGTGYEVKACTPQEITKLRFLERCNSFQFSHSKEDQQAVMDYLCVHDLKMLDKTLLRFLWGPPFYLGECCIVCGRGSTIL